jgi:hypothetical protein
MMTFTNLMTDLNFFSRISLQTRVLNSKPVLGECGCRMEGRVTFSVKMVVTIQVGPHRISNASTPKSRVAHFKWMTSTAKGLQRRDSIAHCQP